MMTGIWKKGLALSLALAMALSFAGCGGTEETLTVGTSADYPPYEFIQLDAEGNETIVGADIELAKIIAEKLGMKMELKNMSFDGLLGGLAEGKFDMVIAGLTVDPKRKVLFSDNYNTREQTVIIKAADAEQYTGLKDLEGKKVAGQSGTVQQTLAEEYAGETATAIQQFPDMIMMLKAGKLDAMIADDDVAQVYIQANDDLMAAPIQIDYENADVAIAFQQDDQELCDKVNAVLAELKEDGTIDGLMADAQALAGQIEKENASKTE